MKFIQIASIFILLNFSNARDIIRIRSITSNNAVLDIDNGVDEGKRAQIWQETDKKWQRWIVDMVAGLAGVPTIFENLDQIDLQSIKILDEDQNLVTSRGDLDLLKQKWFFRNVTPFYQIVNGQSLNCLKSNGLGNQITTTICNPSDSSQLWTIENFSQLGDTWTENWLDHNQLLTNFFDDSDITVYYDQDMDKSITWMNSFVGDVWRYSKQIYGNFGPNEKLIAIFHQGKYGGGTPNYFWSSFDSHKNSIDLGANDWSSPQGWNIDSIIHEVGHVVESCTKGYHESPAFGIWRDSMWAEIFIYDVYKGLGMNEEMNRVFNDFTDNEQNFPRAGTQWFRDFFWPIYSNYGESSVLVGFYDMLAGHFPKRGYSYLGGMNMGEFIHFWSGAAKTNLQPLAENAFGWTSQFEQEFQDARTKFPGIIY